MKCPHHGEELEERIIWSDGKKVGRLFYCPHEGCEYKMTAQKERPRTRPAGQSAIDGKM